MYEPDCQTQEALKELADALEKMPKEKKVALDIAAQRLPSYVENEDFRIKFLRAEAFDAHSAATRMALYFDAKLDLFGESALCREILLSDLDNDDMDCLRTGYLQVLADTDFGDRKVLFYYHAVSDCYRYTENLLRSFWYVANVLSTSEDVQKLGVANVVFNLGGFPKHGMDYEKSRRLAGLFKAIPLRFCSFYPCIDTRAWAVVVDTFSVITSKYLSVRLRVIKGDHEEGESISTSRCA